MIIPYEYTHGGIELGDVKPCPFCGKVDKLVITPRSNFEDNYKENGAACILISCKNCHSSLTEHDYNGNSYEVKAGILVSKWNNRRCEDVGD